MLNLEASTLNKPLASKRTKHWSHREQFELYTGTGLRGVLKSHVHRSSIILVLLCRGHMIVARLHDSLLLAVPFVLGDRTSVD